MSGSDRETTSFSSALPPHPYYPQDAAIPGYQPNATPVPVLIGSFGALLAFLVGGALALARWSVASAGGRAKRRRFLSTAEQLLIAWFVLCR